MFIFTVPFNSVGFRHCTSRATVKNTILRLSRTLLLERVRQQDCEGGAGVCGGERGGETFEVFMVMRLDGDSLSFLNVRDLMTRP